MKKTLWSPLAALSLALAACAAPRPREAPPPPPPPAEAPFPYEAVWTRRPGTPLHADSARSDTVPHLFTRLQVLRADSALLYVRCAVCPRPAEGWVEKGAVVYEPTSPEAAARGEPAELLLSVRAAAERRDVQALRQVMSRHFTHSLGGADGIVEALASWEREGYRSLGRLPALLDRGVATRDGRIWAAPPEWAERPDYLGPRAGFRREGGRWEWIFLIGNR